MVRVIPIHKFSEQTTVEIEEPTAACIATISNEQDYLLTASPSHSVEVQDLSAPNIKYVTSFPTADFVEKLIYCKRGNYVATLEVKNFRDNSHKQSNAFVRVYVNWLNQERQPMRARIAGRVTPSLNRTLNSMEMIELPLNNQPTTIACCQTTGNIIVAAGNTLVLHEFKIETQNLSKLKFIDFEARPWSLELHFSPSVVEIVEDFISVMNSSHFVAFRLVNKLYDDIDQLSSSSNDKTTISTDVFSLDAMDNISINTNNSNEQCHANQKDCLVKNIDKNSNPQNFMELLKKKKRDNIVDWNRLEWNEKLELNHLVTMGVVDKKSQEPFTFELPSVSLERAGPGHMLSPFILNSTDTEVVIKTNPDNGWSENYVVKHIIRLKICRNSFPQLDTGSEIFTNHVLKPLYLKTSNNYNGLKRSILRSDSYKYLNGVSCLICTIQEGYIYHFNVDEDYNNPNCLTAYPFTAPVLQVALEYTVLHALTEAGLESYTLRLPHYVAKTTSLSYDLRSICPDITEPVSLIGLRPFSNVEKLLYTDNTIALLAQNENSWFLHLLKLPKPETIYYDIINAAKNHKITSPSTYCHLLEEAHTMLRLAKDIAILNEQHIQNDQKLETLYDQSCALLGDYYINTDTEDKQRFCISYYKMSGLKPSQILCRKSTKNALGLAVYIRDVLLDVKSGPEADALFQSRDIVEIISKESMENIFRLVLRSTVLREYATEKLIKLIESKTQNDFTKLALALLYILTKNQNLVNNMLKSVSQTFLHSMLLEYPHILFDETTDSKNYDTLSFSEISTALISCNCLNFAKILSLLCQDEIFSLQHIIQVFLEYLPSRIGKDGQDAASAMQLFLETYLSSYFSSVQDKNNVNCKDVLEEAFKILVISYLGKLMQSKLYKIDESSKNEDNEDNETYLFESQRPKYLNLMPPCAKDYEQIVNINNCDEYPNLNSMKNFKQVMPEILKLQALMASDYLPVECLQEIEQFLDKEDIEGKLAFQTLCIRNTEKVTVILIERCPQAVLQYAKDMYSKESDWKVLIELIQQCTTNLNYSEEMRLFFEQILIDALKYIAEIFSLKSLHYILPKNDEEMFQKYFEICGPIVNAEYVKSLLMETGRQLLSTINL